MQNKEISITGWRAGWLERELPAFEGYASGLTIGLQLCILTLALATIFRMRTFKRELAANPSQRASIFARLDKTLLKMCRGHLLISLMFLINALIISLVDAYIGISALSEDVSQDPASYDSTFVIEMVLYCAYITVVFLTAFFVVPLLQMLLVTSILARFMRKRGVIKLSGYLMEARMYTTHIAQIWTIAVFFMMAWWKPTPDAGLIRWVVLQAAIGSSCAWLDASFAFNFSSEKLADTGLALGNGRLMIVVRLFTDTVSAAHTSEKNVLPRYTDVTKAATIDEKTPLTTEN